MEPSSAAGGGGPAPFLLKTYDMVDDASTDGIVSWSSNNSSFVVWDPPEFARILLPTYFKHNNFSSFIRQLNTYGFRKIDPEKWEFANEEFVKDHKHLLKNIRRRKPIHSHSHPQGSSVDPERAAFDEEIERLSHDKATLQARVVGFEQQRSAAKLQLEELKQRLDSMEQRQEALVSTLEKSIKNPAFVKYLAQKLDSMDFLSYNKKRRLPEVDQSKPVLENSFVDDHISSRPEFGDVIHKDFSNKLTLELSPAVSDINLVSQSTQSSDEDVGSPYRKTSGGDPKDTQTRMSGLSFAPETLELSDFGASYTFKMDSAVPRKVPANESAGLHILQQNLISNEDSDGYISCHLNLTLASTPLQVDKSSCSSRISHVQEGGKNSESRFDGNGKESNARVNLQREESNGDRTLSVSQEASNNNQGPPAAPVRVNDVFWEQFLTERPGSSDNEEASSNYRANPFDAPEDTRPSHGMFRNSKGMEQLSL